MRENNETVAYDLIRPEGSSAGTMRFAGHRPTMRRRCDAPPDGGRDQRAAEFWCLFVPAAGYVLVADHNSRLRLDRCHLPRPLRASRPQLRHLRYAADC